MKHIKEQYIDLQFPSKLLEMPEGALVTIWEIAIFQSAFFFNKAVAPFIFNELYRAPHLECKRWLEKFCRSLAKRNSEMQIYNKFQNIIRV